MALPSKVLSNSLSKGQAKAVSGVGEIRNLKSAISPMLYVVIQRRSCNDVPPFGNIVLSSCNGLHFLPLAKGPIMLKVFPGFSFDQHQITGQQIYNAREFFGKLHYDLLESYGESARPVRLVEDIIETIDRLRTNLGEVVCTENPDREDWELDQCYYSVSD